LASVKRRRLLAAQRLPDWRERGAPVKTPVTAERVEWLTSANGRARLPKFLVPRALRNHGNFVISLGELCQWLASQAEALGYQAGYELRAKYTVLAEGCRGHLGRRLEARFGLGGEVF
jgi:electron-transferring-flavoprotein dehydrogenase